MKNSKDEMREPGENTTIDAGQTVINDPIIASNPSDKEYTKYKANVTTDATGSIPDIPEVEQQAINVDFTKDTDATGVDDITGEQVDHDGRGGGGSAGDDFSMSDKGGGGEESKVDLTTNEKFLMASVLTNISMEGFGIANDFIIDKWLITEDKVQDRILEGVVAPNILDFVISYGSTTIGIRELLVSQKEAVEKSLTFTREEKKRFTELLALMLKDKNIQLKPEWMLVAMIFEKYGIGVYQMAQINKKTEAILNHVNEMVAASRAQSTPVAAPGNVTLEDTDGSVAQNTHPKPPKVTRVKTKKATKKAAQEPEVEETEETKFNPVVAEIRETGETAKPKRQKRTVDMSGIQDVPFEKA